MGQKLGRLKPFFDLIFELLQFGEHAEHLFFVGTTRHVNIRAVICFVIAEFHFDQIEAVIAETDEMALYLRIGSERNCAAAGLQARLAGKIKMLSVRNITAGKALREQLARTKYSDHCYCWTIPTHIAYLFAYLLGLAVTYPASVPTPTPGARVHEPDAS